MCPILYFSRIFQSSRDLSCSHLSRLIAQQVQVIVSIHAQQLIEQNLLFQVQACVFKNKKNSQTSSAIFMFRNIIKLILFFLSVPSHRLMLLTLTPGTNTNILLPMIFFFQYNNVIGVDRVNQENKTIRSQGYPKLMNTTQTHCFTHATFFFGFEPNLYSSYYFISLTHIRSQTSSNQVISQI